MIVFFVWIDRFTSLIIELVKLDTLKSFGMTKPTSVLVGVR